MRPLISFIECAAMQQLLLPSAPLIIVAALYVPYAAVRVSAADEDREEI